MTVVEACPHQNKTLRLWLSIKKVIEAAVANDDDVIVICTKRHQLTEHYKRSKFLRSVYLAGVLGCNILIGGMAAFNLALPIADDIFWIDSFKSSQFFVVYRSFYKSIIQEPFGDSDTLESKFSEMTSCKMALHPFISEEKNSKYQGINYKDNLEILIAENSIANERLLKLKNAWNKFNNQIDVKL